MTGLATSQTRAISRWLTLGRAAWIGVAILTVAMYIIGAPALLAQLQVPCMGNCIGPLPPAERLQSLATYGLSAQFYATYILAIETVVSVIFLALATLIFWRRPTDVMALFGAFTLLFFVQFTSSPSIAGEAHPFLWPYTSLLSWLAQVCFVTFFCIFPDGRFRPAGIAWLPVVWGVYNFIQIFLPNVPYNPDRFPLFTTLVWPGCFGIMIAAQIYRYLRVSSPSQRQQTKWVVFGFAAGVGGFVLGLLVAELTGFSSRQRSDALVYLAGDTVIYLFFLLIPLSFAAAILRSRLWEIDLIIRRTLSYGVLTGLLALLYLGVVTLLQSLFTSISHQQSAAAIVISTLGIAAMFNPLRRRVHDFIDRRFYRQKYDADKMTAAFAAIARDEVNLDKLITTLLDVIQETMQPEKAALWLRDSSKEKFV